VSAAAGLQDERPKGQVRHKVAVHHIHMNPICPGLLASGNLLTQAGEISRQYGRGQYRGFQGDINGMGATQR
jgi:hypothetical protein